MFIPNNYIFLMKSVIFTIFFAILSQEAHQNLMWKIVTSSNLNPLLKFYFYSPILANNNMLLKIYYENIVVEFLSCHFFFLYYFSILSFYHPYVSFFFLLIFLHHTRIPIYPYPLPFFFSTFHFPKPPSLFLSPALFLNFFFFFIFYLIPTHYPAFSIIRNRERGRERNNRWVRWLCSAAPSALPPPLVFRPTATCRPPHHQLGQIGLFLFLFFFFIFACSDLTLF